MGFGTVAPSEELLDVMAAREPYFWADTLSYADAFSGSSARRLVGRAVEQTCERSRRVGS